MNEAVTTITIKMRNNADARRMGARQIERPDGCESVKHLGGHDVRITTSDLAATTAWLDASYLVQSYVVNPNSRHTHTEATEAARTGKQVELVTRDATGDWYVRHYCRLNSDGDLVMMHPTNSTGYISAPIDGQYSIA